MPISGVVVICRPDCCSGAAQTISALDGVDIHGVMPEGRIVAVIEADTVEQEVALVSRMHEIPGVSSVNLAYHSFEDL